MRVDNSSNVESRAKRRYSSIGRGSGDGTFDHDRDGVEGLPPFVAIGEEGVDSDECPRDGSDRARNRPATIKRMQRKKRKALCRSRQNNANAGDWLLLDK